MSDEFAAGLDVCIAKDSQRDELPPVLVAVSNDNVYDGYIGKGFPSDLKRTFIAIRKKNSEEVGFAYVALILICFDNLIYFPSDKISRNR